MRFPAELALTIMLVSSATAGPFDEGLAAANGGDYAGALLLWRPLAVEGDVSAQYNLGAIYENGLGVTQDYVEALKWYQLAAAQGDGSAPGRFGTKDAEYRLGSLFAEGRGVPQDYIQAHMWLNLAGARGHILARVRRWQVEAMMPPAQILEAQRLARERFGAPRDSLVRSEIIAAVQGDGAAQNKLADRYEHGNGVPEDNIVAVTWYRLAAGQGVPKAQVSLGMYYLFGQGVVSKDYVLAHMWFNLAAARGDRSAGELRDAIARREMTPTQIGEAQGLAREWKPTQGR